MSEFADENNETARTRLEKSIKQQVRVGTRKAQRKGVLEPRKKRVRISKGYRKR